jgi:hypothetical protein
VRSSEGGCYEADITYEIYLNGVELKDAEIASLVSVDEDTMIATLSPSLAEHQTSGYTFTVT